MTENTKQTPKKSENTKNIKRLNSTKQYSSKLASISLVIALVAILASTFNLIKLHLFNDSLNRELLIASKTINDLAVKHQAFKKVVTQANIKIKQEMDLFDNTLKEQKKLVRKNNTLRKHFDNYWQLKKVQFYLQLAQINAHWSQQPETTVNLLKQANLLLFNLNQADIYSIRQQIATEIAAIEKQPKVDILKVLSQINTIQSQIQKLSYRDVHAIENNSKKPKKEKGTWRQFIERGMDALKKLVIIRHHDQSVRPILSDKQLDLVKEVLYVQLQQSKWAVIYGNQGVFKLTVKQIIKQILLQFNQQQPLVTKIANELESLRQIQLKQKTFKLNKSLLMLNKHIQSLIDNDPSYKKTFSGEKH